MYIYVEIMIDSNLAWRNQWPLSAMASEEVEGEQESLMGSP